MSQSPAVSARPQLAPITEIATKLGLSPEEFDTLGRHKAKVDPGLHRSSQGKLVLVSAIGPTKAGEGKTTVSVGLADGLSRLGHKVALALREPSLGPVFGIKGGGTGGGAAQVEPADDINLHFTGDLHAISTAHNLLAALVDNDLHFGGKSGLMPESTTWARAVDMNDRALRNIVISAGSPAQRESRFDITAASEIMAILALAADVEDLRARLARIVVGSRADGSAVTAGDLGATEAMLALLQDALRPNLVQTREGTPAFVHTGPFGNIAHGCSSVVGTRTALKLADIVISEAGFGFDLGGEKFLDIKMRQADLWPAGAVLVSTVRALVSHGDGSLERGLAHLDRQLDNVARFGLPCVVALNVFPDDMDAELRAVEDHLLERGIGNARFTAFTDGGAGAVDLAKVVADLLERTEAPQPRFLYELSDSLEAKIEKVSRSMYGAAQVTYSSEAIAALGSLTSGGYAGLPICIAKTHLSFSADPKGGGLARDFGLEVKEVRLAAGAGFVVVLLGKMVTMPALPRVPAALGVKVAADGDVTGLMSSDPVPVGGN